MKRGDWRTWLSEDLYANVARVIELKQRRSRPYYIEVRITRDYAGPALGNRERETTTMELTAKHVYGVRLVCLDEKPIIPQLGTLLFYVDNRRGYVNLLYAMPADKPNDAEDSDNYGPVVAGVAEQARRLGVPLLWN